MTVQRVRWWGYISAAIAPTALIGGWTLAAARQPAGYDPARESISSLAAVGANDRWLMTSALVVTGVCHLVTAAALVPVALPGRAVLALGGLATILVAAVPMSVDGHSVGHAAAATVAFIALAAWPAFAAPAAGPPGPTEGLPGPTAGPPGPIAGLAEPTEGPPGSTGTPEPPWPLHPVERATAAAVLLGLLVWFGVELAGDTARLGLAERAASAAQSAWPLIVVAALRRNVRRRGRHYR